MDDGCMGRRTNQWTDQPGHRQDKLWGFGFPHTVKELSDMNPKFNILRVTFHRVFRT